MVELTPELEEKLKLYEEQIRSLLESDQVPEVLGKPKCKNVRTMSTVISSRRRRYGKYKIYYIDGRIDTKR